MRWSLRLSEFDFEIEHVPSSKIKHVDALSRHVGLVEETHLMSKEIMMKEQKKDLFCKMVDEGKQISVFPGCHTVRSCDVH